MNRNQARRASSKLLERIALHAQMRSSSTISQSITVREISRYLRSSAAKAVVLNRWLPKVSDHYLLETASGFDVLAPFPGPVPWRFQSRGQLGKPPRGVCNLPVPLRVSHGLAKKLVEAQVVPGRHIGNWRGRGRDHQIRQLRETITSLGPHVLLADVRQCFASVRVDHLYELDLFPLELVRNALDHRALRFVRYGRISLMADIRPLRADVTEQTAPCGLLEGSPASNALLAAMFNDLPDHLGGGVEPFLFSDNIAVVCSSEEACAQAESSLVRYFTDHRAGPFTLTLDRAHLANGFDHLGYRFSAGQGGEVLVEQSDRNYIRALARLEEADLDLFRTPSELAAYLLSGFPAVSCHWRSFIEALAEDQWF